jgi:biopolymer transport protein ExbD
MKLLSIALVAAMSAQAIAEPGPFKVPTTGAEACDLALPTARREAVFGKAKLEARLVAHGAICTLGDGTNRAVVIVLCGGATDVKSDGDWTDLDDGLAGTIAIGDKAAFAQRFDGACVVTVEASGAWAKLARDVAKAVHTTTTVAKGPRVPPPPPRAQLALTIADDGRLWLAGTAIELDALGAELAKRAAKDPELSLVIQAGRGVAHAVVVKVMERAKQAGITHLAIGTAP